MPPTRFLQAKRVAEVVQTWTEECFGGLASQLSRTDVRVGPAKPKKPVRRCEGTLRSIVQTYAGRHATADEQVFPAADRQPKRLSSRNRVPQWHQAKNQ